MNISELKSPVEALKLLLLSPKLYVTEYFNDLVNQLDIGTTKFQIAVNEKKEKKLLEAADIWRQQIIEEFEKEKKNLMNKLESEYKLDFEMKQQVQNIIKLISEEISSEQKNLSFKEIDDLDKKIYEYSLEMKRKIMDNRCYMVISIATAYNINNRNIESIDLWRNIMPIIRINEGFIDKKGQGLIK